MLPSFHVTPSGHLLWGDVTGYVWGKTNQRIEVPIVNERQRQTYFGALNYSTQEFLVKAYERGNWESTIEFLKYLHWQYIGQRLALFRDGASASIVHKKSELICNWLTRAWQKTFGRSPVHG